MSVAERFAPRLGALHNVDRGAFHVAAGVFDSIVEGGEEVFAVAEG